MKALFALLPFFLLWCLLPREARAQEDTYAQSCINCVTKAGTTGQTLMVCNCPDNQGIMQSTQISLNEPGGTGCRDYPTYIWNNNGALNCTSQAASGAAQPAANPIAGAVTPAIGNPGTPSANSPGTFGVADPIVVAVTPPPPPAPSAKVDTSRADNWVARFHDPSLFTGQVSAAQQVNGTTTTGASKIFIQQNDAYASHMNVLFGCADTSLHGRTDADCAAYPNGPECAGILRSLDNATTCDIPPPAGSPPGTPCLSYGKYGFVMEEWLVFGNQFYDGMSTCNSVSNLPNNSNARRSRMVSLSDYADLSLLADGMGGIEKTGASTITGKTKKELDASTITSQMKEMASKTDDGATYLGYEKGEVILKAFNGTSFSKVFSESPFAEKLSANTKDQVIGALADPKDVVGRVKEKKLAMKEKNEDGNSAAGIGKGSNGKDMMAELEKAAGDNSTIAVNSLQGKPPSAAEQAQGQATAAKAALAKAAIAKTPLPESKGKSHAAPAAEAVDPAANLARAAILLNEREASSGEGRAPASFVSGDISLFERVRHSYRRYAPQMKESKTAHDVRTTELPAFFQDL